MLYSTVGTAFCGWACPQNTLSEIANDWTYRLLGKRADMSVAGEKMKVASSKDHWLNWLLLGLIFVAISMVLAFIPLLYFYPPDVIWSFIIFRDDERLADSLHYIYFICVLIVLVDVSFIRHFWCRFMCVYRVWQHGFKTHQTLRLAYDESRSEQCEKCNYRFSTLEEMELLDIVVVKRDGDRESYSRSKLVGGMLHSLTKRPYTQENFDRLVHAIERDIQKKKKREFTSQELGELVMKHLRKFDKVAYIRFASIYRAFEDVGKFKKEIMSLEIKKRKK